MLAKENNWTLLDKRAYERQYMRPLFEFVLGMFIEIFGEEIMFAEPCIVFNDPSEDYPMLITNSNPIKMRTNACSLKHWAQFITHLSHELTHYAIRQQKKNKGDIVKWFEETICEAMSMYILRLAADRWTECALYNLNTQYAQSLTKHYTTMYNKTSDSVLRKCSSYVDLQSVESTCENDRDGRSIDRNYLFDTFVSMPNDIKITVYYTQYIQLNGLQIDFNTWKADSKSSENFITKLGSIQPVIGA